MDNSIYEIDYYRVFDDNGVKTIKFLGFLHESNDDSYDGNDYENEALFWRATEISFGEMPLEQFLKDIEVESYNDIAARFKWYTEDITLPQAIEIANAVMADWKELCPLDITMDTPCGEYWC